MFNIGHKFDCLNQGCLPFKCQSLHSGNQTERNIQNNNSNKKRKTRVRWRQNQQHQVNDVKTPKEKSVPCSTSVSYHTGFISFHSHADDPTLSFGSLSEALPTLSYPFLWVFVCVRTVSRETAVFNFLSHSLACVH